VPVALGAALGQDAVAATAAGLPAIAVLAAGHSSGRHWQARNALGLAG
jgi:hypothetical protein